MGMSLSAGPIYPCRLVLYSAHGNECIDLHFRPPPEVANGDDNISSGNKLRRLKMDARVWTSERGVKMPASHSSVYLFYDLMKITLHLLLLIIINRYETIPIFVLLLLFLMIKPKTEM